MEIKGKDVVRQVSMLAGHIADMRGASYEDYERTVSALWDDPPLAAFLLRQSVGDFARGVSAWTPKPWRIGGSASRSTRGGSASR